MSECKERLRADLWNQDCPIGTKVLSRDPGVETRVRAVTTSEAWFEDGYARVRLRALSGTEYSCLLIYVERIWDVNQAADYDSIDLDVRSPEAF